MVSKDIVESRIKEKIGDIKVIQAEDVSGGCGSMFNLLIVSDKFKGLSRINQHRLVHQALGEIKDQIHALSLKLYTTEQYSKLQPMADDKAKSADTDASAGNVENEAKEKTEDIISGQQVDS